MAGTKSIVFVEIIMCDSRSGRGCHWLKAKGLAYHAFVTTSSGMG